MLSKRGPSVANLLFAAVTGCVALMCVVPFLMILAGSFSNEQRVIREGYGLAPRGIDLEAYRYIFRYPQGLLSAYKVTILVAALGTALSLGLMSMTAYVIYRKDFRWRRRFAFFFYFTTLFNGGIFGYYMLVVKYLHLRNTLAALIVPGAFNVFFLLIMRTYISLNLPDSLVEAAKIDGGGDFLIYYRVVLPLITPILATIGLFEVLGHWNSWYSAMLFISNERLYPLQYYLYRLLANSRAAVVAMSDMDVQVQTQKLPLETLKLALTVIVTGPIILAYPFVQRYFITGLVVGSIKG